MISRQISFWLGVAMLWIFVPSLACAQSVYKCPSRNGGYEYTDLPCSGPGTSVMPKATPAELAVERNARDRQAILSMLRSMRVEEAKRYAVAHNQESLYNSILAAFVREQTSAAQRREQQAKLAQQQRERAVVDKINQLSEQNNSMSNELRIQRRLASESEQRARYAEDDAQNATRRAGDAQNAARRARQEAQMPKYNSKTKQWCQQTGGTLQCH